MGDQPESVSNSSFPTRLHSIVGREEEPLFGYLIFWVGLASMACWVPRVWAADPASDSGLEEIVIAAEKYNSTVQNTPITISALSGDQLVAAGISTVEDAAHEVLGLSMRSAGP